MSSSSIHVSSSSSSSSLLPSNKMQQQHPPPPPPTSSNKKNKTPPTTPSLPTVPQSIPLTNGIDLYSHLPQYTTKDSLFQTASPNVHPAIVEFSLRSSKYTNIGSILRCREMLLSLREAILSYRCHPDMAISRHLDLYLKPMIGFMVEARPLSTTMANSIRSIRHSISILPPETSEQEAQESVLSCCNTLIKDRIDRSIKQIARHLLEKFNEDEVILTYAGSTEVMEALLEAKNNGKKFSVIIVDSRPFDDAIHAMNRLVEHGIECSFIGINSVSYIMPQVTKTIIGTSAICANGTLLARVGTSSICSLSKEANVPVIVLCPTLAFSERSQSDSFVFNELANPDSLICQKNARHGNDEHSSNHNYENISISSFNIADHSSKRDKCDLSDWKSIPCLKLLNIVYDITPSSMVTVVVTEIGLIPPTSIPVVLREYNNNM